ncbi:MAG TPA: hypothetical protein VFF16_19545, partial [Telluria sp.]|nr:hypothetical protein [Telluria sp.]
MTVEGVEKGRVRAGSMVAAVDDLLRQWGQERAAPALEASVRSPLGDTDQWLGGGRSSGGERGLTLYSLAKVRYVHAGEQPPVAAQIAELAISERTYRTQVAELHRAVAERLEKRLREADRVAW